MARARNIKPGFYKNEDLAECSVWARFIFPGLWMLADREGRLEDRPKRIKAELLPFDGNDVDKLLAELEERGFIVRYHNEEGKFIQISKFNEHQSPHYSEKASVIKPPQLRENGRTISKENSASTPEKSGSTPAIKEGSQPPDSLIPDSLIPESRLSDSPIVGKSVPRKRGSPKTPIPEGFTVSERVREWAAGKGFADLDAHCESFIGKAKAKGYTYTDWDEALMCAIRDDWAGLRSGRAGIGRNSDAAAEAERRIFGGGA